MTTALTGAGGFLGWHTRAALHARGETATALPVGRGFDPDSATAPLSGSDHLIHIAGVNRAPDHEVYANNVQFARQIADTLARAEQPPSRVTFANSTQAGSDTPYGRGKEEAAGVLATACADLGIEFADIRLPNLFGEHGKPFYNAVTSTFCHLLAEGEEPTVQADKELTLLHAQDAADLLTGHTPPAKQAEREVHETVSGLLMRLQSISAVYRDGQVPDISSEFDRNLFNTYRSYTFPAQAPVKLTRHADARGSFFELIRAHGGTGQASFSTTVPGISRGDHYHRRKVERFVVLEGNARISLRRLFSDEVVSFDVDGEAPVAVDMPTLWAHNITNTGERPLFTHFWTNDLFDPSNPDTIAEVV